MDNVLDLIAVGDATIDAFLSIHDASLHCRLDKEKCELCVKYGEKIPVDDCSFRVGGNGCNVAVGISRLGFKSGLCAELGDDEFSLKITNNLSREKVDKSLIKTVRAPTSFAIGISFQAERTLFVEHVKRQHEFLFSDVTSKWIYLTSLGNEWKNAYKNTLSFAKEKNIKLAFSPGTLQLDAGYQALRDCLLQADILFLNKEEGQKLWKSYKNIEEPDVKKLLSCLESLGPKVVVVTDGTNGSYVLTEQKEIIFQGIFPETIVERTGAGDAYATGFLGAVFSGKSYKEASIWGTLNARSVVGAVGAQGGLLGKTGIENAKKELSSYL